MMFKTMAPWMLAIAALTFAPGCSEDDDDGGTSGGSAGGDTGGNSDDGASDAGDDGGDGLEQGFTDCTPMGFEDTPTICQPGQYCNDATFADCENGCLSNVNCAENQACTIPSGASVGACENQGAAVSEADFCMKLLTCDPNGTQEECSAAYTASSNECRQCIVSENCNDILDFDGACDDACGFF